MAVDSNTTCFVDFKRRPKQLLISLKSNGYQKLAAPNPQQKYEVFNINTRSDYVTALNHQVNGNAPKATGWYRHGNPENPKCKVITARRTQTIATV
jgi:hypothetical protein